MKKTCSVTALFFICAMAMAQGSKDAIAKITYRSVPVSQYCISKSDTKSTATTASTFELLNGYKTYYTLWVNLKNRASIYEFDSLAPTRVKGREGHNVSVADEVRFCIKPVGNTTYKSESIMGQPFKTQGTVGDIEWEISNEKKKILGFECTKAVSKNKDLMMTVWFTNAIPVSAGPAIYFGLPGLVVWAEDFFRTTQVEKVEYLQDVESFEAKMKKMEKDYITFAKKNFTKEPILILRKAELGKDFYNRIHANDRD
jgi:GLPGLI family protein